MCTGSYAAADFLRRAGVPHAQGFHIGKPMHSDRHCDAGSRSALTAGGVVVEHDHVA